MVENNDGKNILICAYVVIKRVPVEPLDRGAPAGDQKREEGLGPLCAIPSGQSALPFISV